MGSEMCIRDRNGNLDGDVVIASNGIVAESGNPALGHEEFALRLHARRNLEIDETVDGANLHGAAEDGFGVRDGRRRTDVDVFETRQLGIVSDVDENVEIARRTASATGVTLASDAQTRSLIHARRDAKLNLLPASHATVAAARWARRGRLSGATARLARGDLLKITERGAHGGDDLPLTAARPARRRLGASLDAAPRALVAVFETHRVQLLLDAEHGLEEINLDIEAFVVTLRRTVATLSLAAHAAHALSLIHI